MATATKTQTQTPAKKAPAKAAPKAAPVPAARKLRWVVAEGQERNQKGGKNQTAVVEGHTYAIEKAGEGWRASVTVDKKKTVLVEGTFAKCYAGCVTHNRNR